MVEVRNLGKGNQKPKKLKIDKEVVTLLQQAETTKPKSDQISSHPLTQLIQKSCVMLVFP